MRTLYLKELRALLPLQILMILTNSADFFYRPLTQRLDEKAWTDISSYIGPGEGADMGISLVVFGLLIAYSLFPREHDEGTIDFLYSLPVSRRAIFVAKVAAGWTVLLVGCVVLQLSDFTLQSQNPQSFVGEQWRLDVSASVVLLQASFAGIVLCHGLVLSFLRRFGLIPYAMGGWVVISLERVSPTFSYLNVMNILTLEYDGQRVAIPWFELGLHIALAAFCVALAYVLWMGRAEWATALWAKAQKAPHGRAALGCATVLVVIGFFVLAVIISLGDDDESDRGFDPDDDGLRPVSFSVDSAETERFDFTYPSNMREKALALIRGADDLHEGLRQRLSAHKGARVIVDLTEQSPHHEGITAWTKMRVGLIAAIDEAHLRHVFTHELVHSFQFQESQRRLGDNNRATRFFGEGSAEYFAFELVPNESQRRASRQVTLAAWSRHRIRFEVLADDDALRESFDPHLVYPMGESWTAALVEACGAAAPGRVLRAMGREDAPQDLAPMAFWQDTLQAVDCDLEEVIGRWEQMMLEGVESEAEFLAALPRLGGGVASADSDEIVVLAALDRAPLPSELYPEVRYYLRVRDNPGVDDSQIRAFEGDVLSLGEGRRIEFRVPRDYFHGQRFQFQLGLRFNPRCWAYFEPWQFADVQ